VAGAVAHDDVAAELAERGGPPPADGVTRRGRLVHMGISLCLLFFSPVITSVFQQASHARFINRSKAGVSELVE
jgi:hypothetical protein